MPVELRKRKAPPPPPEPPAKKQTKPKATKVAPAAAEKVTKAAAKAAETVKEKVAKAASAATTNGGSAKKPEAGDVVTLEGFGGEIETNDGEKTTLKALVDESKAGVVLFTYPKASTPGCTKQVCFFRDSYEPFTAAGLAIYGLSGDSPKANTAFKEKQKLPYPLLCDPSFTLIGAIGLKKAPKGTTRGVFVVDKSGKVLAAQPGSPEGTLNVVKGIVKDLGAGGEDVEEDVEDKKEEPSKEEGKKDEEAKPNGEVTAAPAEEVKKGEEEKEVEKKDDEVLPDAPAAPAAEEAKEGEEKKE